MLPREIIYRVVINYLDEETIGQLRNDMGKMKYGDAQFIKLLEKYFDFSKLIKNPLYPQDAWIYNYLHYETKRKENHNPLHIGDEISFQGKLPKRGLIKKYYDEMFLGKSTKKFFT